MCYCMIGVDGLLRQIFLFDNIYIHYDATAIVRSIFVDIYSPTSLDLTVDQESFSCLPRWTVHLLDDEQLGNIIILSD